MNYIPVLQTYNAGDIALIKSIFEGEKIGFKIKGENFNLLDPLIQPVTFFVQSENIARAKDLVQDLDITFLGVS